MFDRGVLKTIDRQLVPNNAEEAGSLIVLLTRKRNGVFKGRLVYNGRKQRYKLTSHYASPTLRIDGLMCSLAIGTFSGLHVRSADVSTAFLYVELTMGVKTVCRDTRRSSGLSANTWRGFTSKEKLIWPETGATHLVAPFSVGNSQKH